MFKKKRFLVRVVILFLFIICFTEVNATYIELQPNSTDGKDAYIREDLVNYNGDVALMLLGMTGSSYKLRDLFQFNLSNITSSSTITEAKFEIYLNTSSSDTNITINLHRVTAPWVSGEATWNNRTVTQLWSSPGGSYSSEVENNTLIGNATGWYVIGIRDLVQGWVNGSYTNYGLILRSNETQNEYKTIASSNYSNSSFAPRLKINYTGNVGPSISSVTDNSNETAKTNVSSNVTFTVTWSDLDSPEARIYVCNSTSISGTGCAGTTYCSTDNSSTNPQSCQYTTLEADNNTVSYWVMVCDDEGACSSVSSEYTFFVNHNSSILVLQPNGGEVVNQSLGNYTITFNVSDSDGDSLLANLYYSTSAGARTNLIIGSLNLTSYCTDADGSTTTVNNCSYSWNSSGIRGTYWLDILVNDSFATAIDSSDSSFKVESIIDISTPNITNATITSDLTSGELFVVRANATDENLEDVWAEITDPDSTRENYTMVLESGDLYNTTIEARITGTWYYKVFANDTLEKVGNTSLTSFTVSKPSATPQNDIAPTSALPLSVIKISGQLNATNVLKDVNATLNVYSDFTFLSDYPQTTNKGNFTENETKTVTWFLSIPQIESNYSLNITYQDKYYNNWTSNNSYVDVTDTFTQTGAFVDINSQIEILAGNVYSAEILTRDNLGTLTDASNVKISLIDASGNYVVSNSSYSSQTGTGIYNYSYTTAASQPQGEWLTVVYATIGSSIVEDRQYWQLTGGPFDVRDITITDSTVSDLGISVILENTGGVGQDMTVIWNLTRVDNNALLDSGSDTVLVGASSTRTYTITPSTSYVGQVKITFLGYYSGTETAGAYEVFDTTVETEPSAPSPTGVAVGDTGGRRRVVPEAVGAEMEILYAPPEISIESGESKSVEVIVKNTGELNLHNLILELKNLPAKWYRVEPTKLNILENGKTKIFSVNFTIPLKVKGKSYDFIYEIKSDELTVDKSASLIVTSIKDLLLEELGKLAKEIEDLKFTIKEAKKEKKDVGKAEIFVELADEKIEPTKNLIANDKFDDARLSLEVIKEYIDQAKEELIKFKVSFVEKPPVLRYWVWIVTWILIIVLITVLVLICIRLKPIQILTPREKPPKDIIEDKIDKLRGEIRGKQK